MASTWLLLLLALGCPALPTETTAVLRQAQQGVGRTPFPSLAPPITLLVDGKQQTLVVCLVLDVASPGLESPIWFSAGNGSALDAFTYGPSPAADGTWTSLAQLSLSSEELASWETLVCHTGPGMGHHSQSTQPLQLSAGDTSSARTCLWEPLRGTLGQALRLGALRLLLFKVLLFDVLLTYSRLRAPLATRGYPAGETRQRDPQPPRVGEPSAPTDWSRGSERSIKGQARAQVVCPAGIAAPGPPRGSHPPSESGYQQEPSLGGGHAPDPPSLGQLRRTRPRYPAPRPGGFVCDLPPSAGRSFLGAGLFLPSD